MRNAGDSISSNTTRIAVISEEQSAKVENSLSGLGFRVIRLAPHPQLSKPLAAHPDMQIAVIDESTVVAAPHTDRNTLRRLCEVGITVYEGDTELKDIYPYDIAYNVAVVGKYAFGRKSYTDIKIKKVLCDRGIEMIDVKQGYAKCSTAVIYANETEHAGTGCTQAIANHAHTAGIVTADEGIYKEAKSVEIEALLVAPDTEIRLPGMSYGFIGGAGAMLDTKTFAVAGKKEKLKNYQNIEAFINKFNINIISLSDDPIYDGGGIIILQEAKI